MEEQNRLCCHFAPNVGFLLGYQPGNDTFVVKKREMGKRESEVFGDRGAGESCELIPLQGNSGGGSIKRRMGGGGVKAGQDFNSPLLHVS